MGGTPHASKSIAQPWRWGLSACGFAVVASSEITWSTFGTPPTWADLAAAVALGLGMVCTVVAAILRSRAEGASPLLVIGRALWAPIRFVINLPF